MNCGGDCGSCSGCARELELTATELEFLRLLGQLAFLPVARKADDNIPIYPESDPERQQQDSLALQCMEKKGLISLDYRQPLRGYPVDARYPVCGSIGLTLRGQQVLELLDYQGLS